MGQVPKAQAQHALSLTHPILVAIALSLGAAVSLGLARFSYALLLSPMREDLHWTYTLAGAMNTGNALGYFIGALLTPWLLRRFGPQAALLGGCALTGLFILLAGFVTDGVVLLGQRVLAGVASAFIFIAGGLLAARLASLHPGRAGLLIGIYYGGTGLGIVAAALIVPPLLAAAADAGAAHPWQWAWLAMGLLCLLCTLLMAAPAKSLAIEKSQDRSGAGVSWRAFLPGLAGYFLFGMGYIGYMTFIIALLKEQGMDAARITLFYALLGVAVVASSRIWARLFDRYRGGQPMAMLNALLGVATLLPILSSSLALAFVSGLLFGAVFLSVVASTTVLVRHNLPQATWPAGISMFTTVFAFGQIVGPTIVGWIADGAGGLRHGLLFSAFTLLAGALVAARQRAFAAEN